MVYVINNSLFYGLFIREDSLKRLVETYAALHSQLTVLDILEARRRIHSPADRRPVQGAASKFPKEIWDEIRFWMVPQYLGFLERCAQLGMGKSCDAEEYVELRPKEEWTCKYQEPSAANEICRHCQEYLDNGFRARYPTENIQDIILAIYGLHLAGSVYQCEEVGEKYVRYLGVAVHLPIEELGDHYYGPPSARPISLPLPVINEADARSRMAAFLEHLGLDIRRDTWCDSISRPEEIHSSTNWGTLEEKQEILEEKQRHFTPGVPRWMIVTNWS